MDNLLYVSLKQGSSFNKYQNKIKKSTINHNRQGKKKEGFTNILEENNTQVQNTNKINQQELVELQNLESEFNSKIKEYLSYEKKYSTEIQQQLDRIDPKKNPYLNKNVKLQKGEVGYVTNLGVYKLYPDFNTYNTTAGKNGCPSQWENSDVDGTNVANNPGQYLPTNPNLLVGKYMVSGQSCGNEGSNVYVDQVVNNPSSTYLGCYNDKNGDGERAMIWNPNSIGYTSFEICQKYAVNNGYMYFGLQDVQSDGSAACMVSNDLTTSTKYGEASPYSSVVLWSSNTSGNPGATATINKQGSLIVVSSDGTQIFTTPSDTSCTQGYSQSLGFDAWGNDIAYLSPMSIEQCEQTCNDNNNCKGFVWNKNPNDGCWIKTDVSTMQQNSSYDLYKKMIPDPATCTYQLTAQEDGNLVIYKTNGQVIWASNTNGSQQIANPQYNASNGKFGINNLPSGQVLGSGEWIGSNTGNLRLVMETDGNLVLYTFTNKITCTENRENKMLGSSLINAIYQVNEPGDLSQLGKLAYIDQNTMLKEYPSSMISYSNDFLINSNYDSPGNDLSGMPLTGISQDDCKTQCVNTEGCAGATFDYNNNLCYLKDSNTYPVAKKQGTIGVNLLTRIPGINNAKDCGRSTKITNIDSIQYNNYVKGSPMTEETDCTYNLGSEEEKNNLSKLKNELHVLAEKINNKVSNFENINLQYHQKIGVDEKRMKQNLLLYNVIKTKIDFLQSKENEVNKQTKEGLANMNPVGSNIDMNDLNSMISDTDLIVLQENYRYAGWSILAILLTIITINSMRK